MATDAIRILLCIDDNYLVQAATAIASILDSNKGHRIEIFVAAFDRDLDRSRALADIVQERHASCSLSFIDLDDSIFDGLPITEAFTKSIYLRIVFDRFIDPKVDRVLYLDADTVVCADLLPLWQTDLDGRTMAVCRDFFRADPEAIGFSVDEPYFNSGMLLIDRAAWLAGDFETKVLAFLAEHGKRLPWMDQDALNIVIKGQVAYVSQAWNYQPRCADVPASFLKMSEEDYAEMRRKPKIIHFTTSFKPWNAAHRVHYSERYFDAQRSNSFPRAFVSPAPRPRGLREYVMAVKTELRWRFPQVFRRVRATLRPAAAARMYRSGPGA